MSQIFNDHNIQCAYELAGHVTVPMLSPGEVSGMLAELATLRPDDGFSPLHPKGDGFTYHCSFLDSNRDYRRQVHSLIARYFASKVARTMNGFRILNCNFYVKPPQSGEFEVHQNWPAITDIEDTTVTIWCPLVDVVEGNGALQVVSGSHKILPHIEGPNSPGYFVNFKQALIDKYLKPIPISAGEAIIFDDALIHWSARNDSEVPRVAIQILCVPINNTPAYWYFDDQHPDRFELVEADSEFWLTTDMQDLLVRQPHWKSLGFAPNLNRMLTEEEFAVLLKNGDRIRKELSLRRKARCTSG